MEYGDFNDEEIVKLLEMRGMNESARNVIAKSAEENFIDIEDIIDSNVISEYEGITERLKEKIKKLLELSRENGENIQESDDRDEKDNLDEKDGKEELDKDKKKEVEERKRQKGESEEEPEAQEKDGEDIQEKDEDNKENKKEETPIKDEYLAKLKKLHKMKIVDYKDQMKTGEVDIDRYYMTMIILQRRLNRQRAAFIKEYGSEELVRLENEYLKEENKYRRTIVNNIEASLAKLRAFDQKLEAILDEIATLGQQLEDKSISIEEYNDRINILEKDKLETLWQINKLNPELLEEMQDNLELREKLEKKTTTASIERQKRKDMSALNKARTAGIDYDEKQQEGEAKQANDNREAEKEEVIDETEQRVDELRKKLASIDITTLEGKKEALDIIGEIQTLEAQKMSQEKQFDNLEKNMGSNVTSYSDLQGPEQQREEGTREYQENIDNIDAADLSDNLMEQLRSQALEDPSTPEQAEEYLDNINEISEDAKKEQDDKEKENEETEPPTLWNRRKNHIRKEKIT